MAIRTRYFDVWLLRVTGEAGIRQVVLMAAGLDTRAFRLVWPAQTHLFELDKAAVLHYKAQTLAAASSQPACTRTVIEADLTAVWTASLLVAGFAAQQPAVWLLEGFLFYLPVAQLVDILDALTGLAAPGSWLGCNIVNAAVLTSPWTRPWAEMQAVAGAPWLGALEDPVAFLAERGWTATISQASAPDANDWRWTLPVIPTAAPGMPHKGLSQVFGTSPALVKRMRQTKLRVTSAGDVLAKNPGRTPAQLVCDGASSIVYNRVPVRRRQRPYRTSGHSLPR